MFPKRFQTFKIKKKKNPWWGTLGGKPGKTQGKPGENPGENPPVPTLVRAVSYLKLACNKAQVGYLCLDKGDVISKRVSNCCKFGICKTNYDNEMQVSSNFCSAVLFILNWCPSSFRSERRANAAFRWASSTTWTCPALPTPSATTKAAVRASSCSTIEANTVRLRADVNVS